MLAWAKFFDISFAMETNLENISQIGIPGGKQVKKKKKTKTNPRFCRTARHFLTSLKTFEFWGDFAPYIKPNKAYNPLWSSWNRPRSDPVMKPRGFFILSGECNLRWPWGGHRVEDPHRRGWVLCRKITHTIQKQDTVKASRGRCEGQETLQIYPCGDGGESYSELGGKPRGRRIKKKWLVRLYINEGKWRRKYKKIMYALPYLKTIRVCLFYFEKLQTASRNPKNMWLVRRKFVRPKRGLSQRESLDIFSPGAFART